MLAGGSLVGFSLSIIVFKFTLFTHHFCMKCFNYHFGARKKPQLDGKIQAAEGEDKFIYSHKLTLSRIQRLFGSATVALSILQAALNVRTIISSRISVGKQSGTELTVPDFQKNQENPCLAMDEMPQGDSARKDGEEGKSGKEITPAPWCGAHFPRPKSDF